LLSPGVLAVSPAPGTAHQRASRLLANLLEDAAHHSGADVEVLEAINVEIPGERLTTPDIAVVDGRVADTDPVRYASSAVRLVVEIVSPAPGPPTVLSSPSSTPRPGSRRTGDWSSNLRHTRSPTPSTATTTRPRPRCRPASSVNCWRRSRCAWTRPS